MAESVTYRRSRVNTSVPEQTAFNAQATQRGAMQVSQSLDRMVAFFRQQQAEKIKVEAAEFGAKNAPTLEQVQAAQESGEELSLPGDNNTLYGRIARQAAASTVTDTIELAARKEINSAVIDATARRGNPADLEDKLDAIIQGYGSTFDETVPSMSRALTSKLAMVANSQYTSYQNSYITQARADGKAAWMTNLLTTLTQLDEGLQILSAEGTDKDGNIVSGGMDLDAFVATKLLEANARDFSASEIRALETLMTTKLVDTANQALTNGILKAPNAGTIIQALGRGEKINFSLVEGGPEIETALSVLRQSGLSDSQIASELRTQRTEQLKFIENEEAFETRRSDDMIDKYTSLAMEAIAIGDDVAATDALNDLAFYDKTKASELSLSWRARPGIQYSDRITVERLDNMRDRITMDAVIEVFGDLNQADQKKYYDKAKALDKVDLRLAKNIVKGQLKLPENINLIQEDDPNFANAQIYARARAELEILAAAATDAETDFNPAEAAQQVLSGLQGDFENVTKKIQKQGATQSANLIFSEIANRDGLDGLMANNADLQGALNALEKIKTIGKNDRPQRFKDMAVIDAFISKIQRGLEASE